MKFLHLVIALGKISQSHHIGLASKVEKRMSCCSTNCKISMWVTECIILMIKLIMMGAFYEWWKFYLKSFECLVNAFVSRYESDDDDKASESMRVKSAKKGLKKVNLRQLKILLMCHILRWIAKG